MQEVQVRFLVRELRIPHATTKTQCRQINTFEKKKQYPYFSKLEWGKKKLSLLSPGLQDEVRAYQLDFRLSSFFFFEQD